MPTLEREPEDVVERALVRIRRDQQAGHLHRRAAAAGDPAVASSSSAARFRYLDALDEVGDGMAISEIGLAIGVDRPRASRLTTELVASGLVERRPNPSDSRFALVRLTAHGRSLVNDVRASRRAAVRAALAALTPEESRVFAALLDQFVAAWPREDPAGD